MIENTFRGLHPKLSSLNRGDVISVIHNAFRLDDLSECAKAERASEFSRGTYPSVIKSVFLPAVGNEAIVFSTFEGAVRSTATRESSHRGRTECSRPSLNCRMPGCSASIQRT